MPDLDLGAILTAIVTPFDESGRVDEDAFVALMAHLARNGSDGFVVAGTTGEASTMTDEEHLGLIALAVRDRPPGTTIIAGTGTNDTRHAVLLTERATELGADAILSVTPYYNRPSPLGLKRHYEAIAAATDRPTLLYNIPSRTGTNIPPDLLSELAQIEHIDGVKQSNPAELQLIDGLDLYTGDDATFARTLDMGGAGGISVASHIVGPEMRRMVDEPEHRAEIDASLRDVYETLFMTASPTCTKAALEPAGPTRRHDAPADRRRHRGGGRRRARDAHSPRPAHGRARVSQALRVLPLGGLGEIGKNMTVVEHDDRLVVVDVGLRFPTPEMVGIDLVLPDFSYLRERARDIEAIVVTHGHEDHLGALPWVLRELAGHGASPPVYGGPLTLAMARSKLEEHKLKDVELHDVSPGEILELGPFELELIHMTHSIPDSSAVALGTELGTVLITGDYKFDQTPVDGPPADVSRLAELGREGVLLLCGDSTNVDRPGFSPSESGVGPHLEETFARCEGRIVVTSFASNIHRVQQVLDAAAALDRKVALVGRSMRKNVTIGRRLGHIEVPDGMLVGPREIEDFPDERVVIVSTGSQGEPLSALRRMAYRDHPQVQLRGGDTVVFSATPVPGNERAVNETIDRLYHIGCDVVTPQDAPVHASGHGYAEEIKLMLEPRPPALRDALPRRLQAPAFARRARGGRGRAARGHLPGRQRPAPRHRLPRCALRLARAVGDDFCRWRRDRRHGRCRPARPAHALRRRHLYRRGDDRRAGWSIGGRPRGDLPRRAVPGPGRRARGGDPRDRRELTRAGCRRGDPGGGPAPADPARRSGEAGL